jgi:hypothetical protein
MIDSITLIVVGLGVFALALAFLEYSISTKKRTKAITR